MPTPPRAYADLTHFIVIEAFINRNDCGAIENPFGLCEADAVFAAVLLAFGVITIELLCYPNLQCKYYLNLR